MIEQEQAIAALLKDGKSQTAICKALGVNSGDVKRVKAALTAEQLGNANVGTGPAANGASAAGDLNSSENAALHPPAPQLATTSALTETEKDDDQRTGEEMEAELKAYGINGPLDFVRRLVTAEERVEGLSAAVEELARFVRTGNTTEKPRPDLLHIPPKPETGIKPATPEEEAAYSRWNNEADTKGEQPFNGVAEWRRAGRPGLAA
jgi:hypothetical protein